MLETHIGQRYQRLLVDPLATALARFFSPNQITLLSLVVGLAAAPCIALEWHWLAAILLLLSGYLDTLDGTVARMTGRTSSFGAMLDITCDRLVEWGVILGLYAIAPSLRGLACIIMLGSMLVVITSFLTAGIFIRNDGQKSFNYTPGLMERPEAFIFFMAMIFIPTWFSWLAALFSILVLFTAALRIWQSYTILQSLENS